MDERIAILRTALDQTGRIVAAVQPDQFRQPTPCTDWDVETLLNHTVGGVMMFEAAARGEAFAQPTSGSDLLGGDPAGAYERAASRFRDVLSEEDVLARNWVLRSARPPASARSTSPSSRCSSTAGTSRRPPGRTRPSTRPWRRRRCRPPGR